MLQFYKRIGQEHVSWRLLFNWVSNLILTGERWFNRGSFRFTTLFSLLCETPSSLILVFTVSFKKSCQNVKRLRNWENVPKTGLGKIICSTKRTIRFLRRHRESASVVEYLVLSANCCLLKTLSTPESIKIRISMIVFIISNSEFFYLLQTHRLIEAQ